MPDILEVQEIQEAKLVASAPMESWSQTAKASELLNGHIPDLVNVYITMEHHHS